MFLTQAGLMETYMLGAALLALFVYLWWFETRVPRGMEQRRMRWYSNTARRHPNSTDRMQTTHNPYRFLTSSTYHASILRSMKADGHRGKAHQRWHDAQACNI